MFWWLTCRQSLCKMSDTIVNTGQLCWAEKLPANWRSYIIKRKQRGVSQVRERTVGEGGKREGGGGRGSAGIEPSWWNAAAIFPISGGAWWSPEGLLCWRLLLKSSLAKMTHSLYIRIGLNKPPRVALQSARSEYVWPRDDQIVGHIYQADPNYVGKPYHGTSTEYASLIRCLLQAMQSSFQKTSKSTMLLEKNLPMQSSKFPMTHCASLMSHSNDTDVR